MKRPRLETNSVAAKEQAAPNQHIDRADDHRRACRVRRPFAIVRELATKCADGERSVIFFEGQSAQRAEALKQARCTKIGPHHLNLTCRLVHDCSAVNDIH